ncbi:hypothetical protein EJ05DRAFT_320207 [Pseudovirgaria hyperparasitica]|uniref:Uncharacterized protein n=1 Tax=Pseudovirgaria hyperparasitica TaxID=470096 RepID=A0A6A6WDK6_9PEZI|nr:uncharacterized protein EJ05DRAFT_320207 [Pseudovirgaria hyperparasitica]KAF2760050.1 hypothetical protein EJ05DRAFT_320207 [Pseudovirgaria hyperparasitica]
MDIPDAEQRKRLPPSRFLSVPDGPSRQPSLGPPNVYRPMQQYLREPTPNEAISHPRAMTMPPPGVLQDHMPGHYMANQTFMPAMGPQYTFHNGPMIPHRIIKSEYHGPAGPQPQQQAQNYVETLNFGGFLHPQHAPLQLHPPMRNDPPPMCQFGFADELLAGTQTLESTLHVKDRLLAEHNRLTNQYSALDSRGASLEQRLPIVARARECKRRLEILNRRLHDLEHAAGLGYA